MKKLLESIRRSFSAQLSIWVVLFAAMIFISALGFVAIQSRGLVRQEAIKGADQILDKTVIRMRDILHDVEIAADNLEWLVFRHLDSPEAMMEYSKTTIQANPYLNGCSISFEPYFFKGQKYFSAYSTMIDGEVVTEQEGSDNYQYFYLDWYLQPKLLHQPCWTEPYSDWDTDDQLALQTQMIISYCMPLSDMNGDFIGNISLDLSLKWLSETISSIKPYPNSYSILVSRGGTFLIHPDPDKLFYQTIYTDGLEHPNPEMTALGHAMTSLENGYKVMTLNGERCYVFYAPLKSTGWSVGIVCPEKDIFGSFIHLRNIALLIVILGLLLMFGVCYSVINRTMKPLRSLTTQAERIASGNFRDNLPRIDRKDEIGILSKSFSDMQTSLVRYIDELTQTTAKKERIEGELQIARDIQMGMVPRHFPPFPDREDVDLFVSMQPAREVGGDFYDYFIQDEQLYFCIGDVSGKGVPASLLMAVAVNLFRVVGHQGLSPEEIAAHLNNQIAADNEQLMFITMFIGKVDLRDGSLSYCNCGHNPPYILQDGKQAFTQMDCCPNSPIGVAPDFQFEGQHINSIQGHPLLLYTDGLNEAENEVQEIYGYERLNAQLCKKPYQNAATTVKELLEAVAAFVGEAPASDDLTVLCLEVHPCRENER